MLSAVTDRPTDSTSGESVQVQIVLKNDVHQMQLQKIQPDDKTLFRVGLDHLANKYVPQRQKLGLTLGVMQTGSQNQRCPNAPFIRGFIEWNLRVEEMARTSVWTLHKNAYKIPGSFSENRHKFFKPSPTSNGSSPCITASKESIQC